MAIALTAGMRALAQATDTAAALKARTLALWVAQNRLAAAQIATPWPALGSYCGDARRPGRRFVWQASVATTPNPAFRRIEIIVAEPQAPDYVLARLTGFLGNPEPPAMSGRAAIRGAGSSAASRSSRRCWRSRSSASSRCLRYRATSSLTDGEARLSAEAQRWRTLEALFTRFEADIRQAIPRSVRAGAAARAGVARHALPTATARSCSRAPARSSSLEPAPAGQRVGYRLRDGTLELAYWPRSIDHEATVKPVDLSAGRAASPGFELEYLTRAGRGATAGRCWARTTCRARCG